MNISVNAQEKIYYINSVGGVRGPFSLQQMRMFVECGGLQKQTAIAIGKKTKRWRPAETRPEIFDESINTENTNDKNIAKIIFDWIKMVRSYCFPKPSRPANRSEIDRIDREIEQQVANEKFITDTSHNRYFMQGPKTVSASQTNPVRNASDLLVGFSVMRATNPVNKADLKKMVNAGTLRENDLVFLINNLMGVKKPVPARTIPGLFSEVYRPASSGSRLQGEFTLEQLHEAFSLDLFSPVEWLFMGEHDSGKTSRMTRAWKIRELFPEMKDKAYCIRNIGRKEVLLSYKQIQDAVSRGEITQTTELKLSQREGDTHTSDLNTVIDSEKVIMAWKIPGLFQFHTNEPRYAVMDKERPHNESFSLNELKMLVEKGQVSQKTFASDGLASNDYGSQTSEYVQWFPAGTIRGLFPNLTNASYYIERQEGRPGSHLGPFSLEELKKFILQGTVHEDTYISVWDTEKWLKESMIVKKKRLRYMGSTQRWIRAESIPGLFDIDNETKKWLKTLIAIENKTYSPEESSRLLEISMEKLEDELKVYVEKRRKLIPAGTPEEYVGPVLRSYLLDKQGVRSAYDRYIARLGRQKREEQMETIREMYRNGHFLPHRSMGGEETDLSEYAVTEQDIMDIAAEISSGEIKPSRGDKYSLLKNLKGFYELKFHKIPNF